MLKPLYTCLFLGLASYALADEVTPLPNETPLAGVDKTMPALELMPPGSVLTQVSLPRYQGPFLSVLVTSTRVVLVSNDEIKGDKVLIFVYNKGKETSRLSSEKASYFLSSAMVKSNEHTTLDHTGITAEGSGLYFDTKRKKGILLGPVTSTLVQQAKTSQ